jgi:hypothetical protein
MSTEILASGDRLDLVCTYYHWFYFIEYFHESNEAENITFVHVHIMEQTTAEIFLSPKMASGD